MYPPSPFGTRSDLLIDLVVLSLVVVVPVMAISYGKARQKAWLFHRNLMVGLSAVLAVAVTLFELDLKAHGGIFEMTRESRYAGTDFLYASIYVHTFFFDQYRHGVALADPPLLATFFFAAAAK